MKLIRYTKMGYKMSECLVKDDGAFKRFMYNRITISYNDVEFYREDVFGPDQFNTEYIFERECKSHHRNEKINELLNETTKR